jgi:tetratricopeptide (TPR) repeat protein
VDVPPTIAALLAARLDRLPPGERAALEAASVVGLTFYRDAVAELASADPKSAAGSLMALSRKELIRPTTSDLPAEEAFRFLHVLLRDTAYAAIPKARRAELHERFARWLDKRSEQLGTDEDEFVGHHLEQVVRLRRELGPTTAATRELAGSAAVRLASAARRLLAADPASAGSLFDRAAALLDPISGEAVDHVRAAAAAWQQSGDLAGAAERYGTAGAAARTAGDARRVRLCDAAMVVIRIHLEPDPDSAAALAAVDQALADFLDDGDDEGILTAGLARLELLNELGTWGPMVALTDQLRPLALRREDPLAVATLIQYRGAALYFGPAPFTEALAWQTAGPEVNTRASEVGRTFSLAATLAHLDRADEARAVLARGEALLADTVGGFARAWAAFGGAHAAVQLEDLPAAEELLRPGIDVLQEIGERSWLSSLVPMLGRVRLERGDPAEARVLAELGRELSNPHDAESQASWRALLARLEAADGHLDEGSRLADEAVRWAETTDQTDTIAEVRCARAEVYERAGRLAESRADLHVALTAYERKGSITGARRVRALLAGDRG